MKQAFILIFALTSCATLQKTNPVFCHTLSRMEIHAHRGSADFPENMIPAFLKAAEQNADVVELDLQVTKDNKIVVAHDPFIKKECSLIPTDKQVFYRNYLLKDVKNLDCGSIAPPGVTPTPGEKIATMDEVFRTLKNTRNKKNNLMKLNIEIKFNQNQQQYFPTREEYMKLLVEVLNQSSWDNSRFIVQSFDFEILKILKIFRPSTRIATLVGDKETIPNIAAVAPDYITPQHELLSAATLKNLREISTKVVPWTVNKPEDINKMIQLGVDGIITDNLNYILKLKNKCGLE